MWLVGYSLIYRFPWTSSWCTWSGRVSPYFPSWWSAWCSSSRSVLFSAQTLVRTNCYRPEFQVYSTQIFRFSVQNAELGGSPSPWPEIGLHPWATDCPGPGAVQVPVDGPAADTFVWLAGFYRTAKEDRNIWWRYQHALSKTIYIYNFCVFIFAISALCSA